MPDINPSAANVADESPAAALENLPAYTRNLLHVRVPVVVTLAKKKHPVKQILELAPGSLIQFEKSCDEPLELSVGEHRIGRGLAVKVGEKFGLKVDHLTPPAERLKTLKPQD